MGLGLGTEDKEIGIGNLEEKKVRLNLKVRVPQSLHHFVGGVGTSSETLTADDLVLGGKTQFSGEVVFGLGGSGVDLFLGLAVAIKR